MLHPSRDDLFTPIRCLTPQQIDVAAFGAQLAAFVTNLEITSITRPESFEYGTIKRTVAIRSLCRTVVVKRRYPRRVVRNACQRHSNRRCGTQLANESRVSTEHCYHVRRKHLERLRWTCR